MELRKKGKGKENDRESVILYSITSMKVGK
jgi:hypothetical protein